jgi:hypothetical protein
MIAAPYSNWSRVCFLLLLLGGLLRAADESTLRTVLDEHRWFDLRDAVMSGPTPPLFRFFVAAAFNDQRSALQTMSAVTHSGAKADQLAPLHYAFYRLYYRLGRYRESAAEERRTWDLGPDHSPSDEASKADLAALEQLPDMQLVSRRSASVTFTTWDERIVSPVTINGRSTRLPIDTGAAISVVTESQAKNLGLRLLSRQPLFEGFTGTKQQMSHYAVADLIEMGHTVLRNVSFVVLPDDLDAFSGLPPNERGAIGMPVLLGVQTLHWDRAHNLSLGFAAKPFDVRNANLSFEELDTLAQVEVAGHRLAVHLDTGSSYSTMWPMFVKKYPELLEGSHESKSNLNGVTGSADVRSAIMPELRMTVAGFPILFRDAPVLLQSTIKSSWWHFGLLGMDKLAQASEVTLDFRAMRIDLK